MAAKTKEQLAEDAKAGLEKDAITKPTPETDQGGVKAETVVVTEYKPDAGGEYTMEIVTTAPGTFGLGGIEPVGKPAKINCSAFSLVWMQPKTKEDIARLKAYRASIKKDAAA